MGKERLQKSLFPIEETIIQDGKSLPLQKDSGVKDTTVRAKSMRQRRKIRPKDKESFIAKK